MATEAEIHYIAKMLSK